VREARYVTKENLSGKSAEWLALAEGRCRAKKRFPLVPERTALLVIDMQRFFTEERSHAYVPAADGILPNVLALVRAYRGSGRPPIFTRHAFAAGEDPGILGRWWGEALRDGDELAEIDPRLAPAPGERVLRKSRYSAFTNLELADRLARADATGIVIAGVLSHLCCESTARDAFARDYAVYFAVDATASDDEELHRAALLTLSDGCAIPVSTEEVLRAMGGR
jgi:isochorismate hydrolase